MATFNDAQMVQKNKQISQFHKQDQTSVKVSQKSNIIGVLTFINANCGFIWNKEFGKCFLPISIIRRKAKQLTIGTWFRFNVLLFQTCDYRVSDFHIIEDQLPTKNYHCKLIIRTVIIWDEIEKTAKSDELGPICASNNLAKCLLFPHLVWVFLHQSSNKWSIFQLVGSVEKNRSETTFVTTTSDRSAEMSKIVSNPCRSYVLLLRLFRNEKFRVFLNKNNPELFADVCKFILAVDPC